MTNSDEKLVGNERRRDRKQKDKLLNGFEHLRQLLIERRQIGLQNYFAKMSNRMLLVIAFIFAIFSMIVMGYFDVLSPAATQADHEYLDVIFYVGISLAIVSGLILFDPNKLDKMLYVWIPIIVLLFAIEFFLQNDFVTQVLTAIIGYGLGLITLDLLYEFFFHITTPSRFVMVIIVLGLIISAYSINDMLQSILGDSWVNKFLVPVIFLVIAYILMIFIDGLKRDKDAVFISDEKINVIPFVSVLLILFFIFLNTGIISGLNSIIEANTSYYSHLAYGLGMFAAVVFSVLMFMYSKKALYNSILVYFIFAFCTYQVGVFFNIYSSLADSDPSFLLELFIFSSGATRTFGYIFGFLLMGKIIDDNSSKRIVKIFLLFGGCFFAGTQFLEVAVQSFSFVNTLVIFSIITSIIFFILIQIDIKRISAIKQETAPVKEITENVEDKKYKKIDPDLVLTKKEMQVFRLLIEGYSLKEIATRLECKYDAVNFHYKNIYKKLDVNTKLELILRYGKENN